MSEQSKSLRTLRTEARLAPLLCPDVYAVIIKENEPVIQRTKKVGKRKGN
jgi:hypothetical protein